VIDVWHDGDITAGTAWEQEIKQHLNNAKIILLLISPDFISSDYCYGTEMQRALERHKQGEAKVIPVILRPVEGWEKVPPGDIQLGRLQALPKDALPVTKWPSLDDAFFNVVEGIRKAVEASPHPTEVPKPSTKLLPRGTTTASRNKANEAQVWDTTTAPSYSDPLLTYRGHFNLVQTVVWSPPDGTHIASCGGDGTVQVWNATTGSDILTYHSSSETIYDLSWSPDGKHIVSTGNDKDRAIQVWDVMTRESILAYSVPFDSAVRVAWSPDSTRIAVSGGNWSTRESALSICSATTGDILFTNCEPHKFMSHIWAVTWSFDSTRVAFGGENHVIQILDSNTGKILRRQNIHYKPVYAVAWSPDDTRIASCSGDGTAQVWDTSTGNSICIYRGHSKRKRVRDVAWSPDSTRVASCSEDGTVQIWDASTGKLILTYRGHSREVRTLAWSPDGMRMVSGSEDGIVQVWNIMGDNSDGKLQHGID